MTGILGKKVGITSIFDSDGYSIPVTVIQAGPCVITQVKTEETDGYNAIQVGYGELEPKKSNKPMNGHFSKSGTSPKKHLMEFKMKASRLPKLGQELTVSMFKEGDSVLVRGISKGKGFSGVVKRHGFSGGPKSHGKSDQIRAGGSIGQSSYPSRVWPGMKMPGRQGNDTVTVKNLKIVKVDSGNNYLYVKGSVPGAKNGIVVVFK